MRLTLLPSLVASLSLAVAGVSRAQPAPPATAAAAPSASASPSPSAPVPISAPVPTEVAPLEDAHKLEYGNREIVLLRARLQGRSPDERALASVRRIDALVERGVFSPVDSRVVDGVGHVTLGGREAITILPGDVDPLADVTLESLTREVGERLAQAMGEMAEAHSPALLLSAALRTLAATLLALLLAALLFWTRDRAARRLAAWLEASLVRPLAKHARGDLWRLAELRLLGVVSAIGRLLTFALALVIGYLWLSFVLRQFPYTRPWGESLRGVVIRTLLELGSGLVAAMPGLFTIAIIVLLTRLVIRLTSAVFRAVEEGRLALPGVHPETAQPTRRLAVVLLSLLAVVVAYPYLPGSGTEAFRGVSVLLGLMLSLGSSGLVSQAMSSFVITYSRALRLGDWVRIGEVEGSVVHAGMLATKILTERNEEVTLPNAVVVASKITNYSRHSGEGVFAKTSVTIGYDTPWRQVEAMLLLAAKRSAGARGEPAPRVFRTALGDFYVEYTLEVAPERPEGRPLLQSELNGHILDVFNEHGVQIMSPNYEADPATPKLVAKDQWYAAPARREPGP